MKSELIIKGFHGKKSDFRIDLSGAEELVARMEALDSFWQKKAARKALSNVADRIVAAARALAPKGRYKYGYNSTKKKNPARDQRKSGTLRRAIKRKALKRSRTRVGFQVHVDSKKFGSMPYYAPMVEFGSKKRGIDPKPFLRPAAIGVRERITPIFRQELRYAIQWAKKSKVRSDRRKAGK